MAENQKRRGLGLEGKNVVVLGVADESSIAWAIARAFHEEGARVHIGYQQRFLSRVRQLLQQNPGVDGARCDVTKDDELEAFFGRFAGKPIDVLVHAIAFGPPELFTEHPSNVSAEALAQSMAISTHSLAKVVRYAKPHLADWASVQTLSFQASERAMSMYGLMGVSKAALEALVRYLALELGGKRVRVNAISPGPIETIAALGIMLAFDKDPNALARQRDASIGAAIARAHAGPEASFQDELALARVAWHDVQRSFAAHSAMDELITQEDVAESALFLGSPLSRKITGQVLRVDCGLSSALIL